MIIDNRFINKWKFMQAASYFNDPISAFKTKLLEQNNNRQQTEVNTLFNEYKY